MELFARLTTVPRVDVVLSHSFHHVLNGEFVVGGYHDFGVLTLHLMGVQDHFITLGMNLE